MPAWLPGCLPLVARLLAAGCRALAPVGPPAVRAVSGWLSAVHEVLVHEERDTGHQRHAEAHLHPHVVLTVVDALQIAGGTEKRRD